MKDQICVVIPTLNEAATIAAVIAGVRPFCDEILVIDGQSSDETLQIARDLGARVEVFEPRGKGLALIEALRLVKHPITVFIDADGSHDPADIPALVAPILAGKADMTIGDRWSGGSDELHGDMNKWLRRSGSRLLTMLVNLRFRAHLIDIQNGFRALRTLIGRQIGLNSPGFTIEQEMAMKFLAGGFRVQNVASHEYARQGGEAKLNLRREWFPFGIVVLRHLFGLERPRIRRKRR
ncbi:MAG TPA: glycosyltransferase family 2 protein [Abditibacterium sp.]|jgi:dolichol-phosphate mannosyltransferase